ncbi:MAG TPA: CPXCG motif-containing cysteine-rich protein [Steroidobacteraceae bacterium]|nr:CPXCG motif-containing cysteine-rich protein [Steroidobacteraceae bacterium]
MSAQPPRKPRATPQSAALPSATLPPAAIDALYGLEPLFEPQDKAGEDECHVEGAQFEAIQCPYCGERFEILADLSAGAASFIEDCQICCRPIELSLEVDASGALACLTVRRSD